MRRSLAVTLLSLLLAACGGGLETRFGGIDYATDVTALHPFGVAVRCRPGESSCTDRAVQMLEPMLLSLGEPYTGPGVEDTSGSPVDGSLLLVFHRDPAVPWQSAEGTGMTKRVAVDAGSLLSGTGQAYVVLDAEDGTHRFRLSREIADALIATLYVRP